MTTETIETGDGRYVLPAKGWEVLRPALQHIADHPAEFYMPATVADFTPGSAFADAISDHTGHPVPECGTVACLAGHIVLQRYPEARDLEVTMTSALALMGLSDLDDQASWALWDVFHLTSIRTYQELLAALQERFVLPDDVPVPAGAVA